jgi:hypothetical protein
MLNQDLALAQRRERMAALPQISAGLRKRCKLETHESKSNCAFVLVIAIQSCPGHERFKALNSHEVREETSLISDLVEGAKGRNEAHPE